MKRQGKRARSTRTGSASNEAKLKELPGGRAKRGNIELWFRAHPKALDFVQTWLRMRGDGETCWSIPDVIAELRRSHEMPAFGASGVRYWLERNLPDAYQAAKLS